MYNILHVVAGEQRCTNNKREKSEKLVIMYNFISKTKRPTSKTLQKFVRLNFKVVCTANKKSFHNTSSAKLTKTSIFPWNIAAIDIKQHIIIRSFAMMKRITGGYLTVCYTVLYEKRSFVSVSLWFNAVV